MRVAIIGGGFYGCIIGLELIKHQDLDVVIFERHDNLLTGATVANQHRLHLGFHYPRCDTTITQAKESFDMFLAAYPEAAKEIKNNIYCVHKDGEVSGQQFLEKMRQHGLSFDEVPHHSRMLCADALEISVRVPEMMLDLRQLRESVLNNVLRSRIEVKLATKVWPEELESDYDFIINCTYTNPGVGIGLRTKSELAVMLLLKSGEEWRDQAITVMDGQFCSIYPAGDGLHTLSSVRHTPAIKCSSADTLEKIAKTLDKEDWQKIESNILEHASSLVDLTGLAVIGKYVTIKTKLEQDINDFRGTIVLSKDKVISVMSGKLSCAFLAAREISKILGK